MKLLIVSEWFSHTQFKEFIMQSLIAVFPNKIAVDNVLKSLIKYGYDNSQVSVLLKENIYETSQNGNKGGVASASVLEGVVSGGAIGGIAGILIGVGSFAIPGLGALLVAGPLASLLGLSGAAALSISGAATGAVAGGLAGGLVELGFSKLDANHYEKLVKEGKIVLSVPVFDKNSQEEIEAIFNANGAEHMKKIDTEKIIN